MLLENNPKTTCLPYRLSKPVLPSVLHLQELPNPEMGNLSSELPNDLLKFRGNLVRKNALVLFDSRSTCNFYQQLSQGVI